MSRPRSGRRGSGQRRRRAAKVTLVCRLNSKARLALGRQALQLRLQATVEGLSIAAISYYVVSLLLYGAKGAQAAGLPLNPEVAVGALLPLVVFGVWRSTRSIQARLARRDDIGAGRP